MKPLPGVLRLAIAALIGYGIFVIVNATVLQMLAGWEDAADYPRGVLRTVGVILLASQLRARKRWAWVVAVGGGALLALAGGSGVLLILSVDAGARAHVSPWWIVTTSCAVAMLTTSVLLLLHRDSRAVFRAPVG